MMKNITFNRNNDVQIENEETIYQGFFDVKTYRLKHRLYDGSWSKSLTRTLCERLPAAACLPYDPYRDEVVLIQQFRLGALMDDNPWLLEIVAGLKDKGDETVEDMIRRETLEECGLQPLQLKKMYEYWVSPGGSDEFLTLYCAKVDAKDAGGVHGLQGESEDIMVHVLKSRDAFALLENGHIRNGITIVALQWLQIHKDHLDRTWKDE